MKIVIIPIGGLGNNLFHLSLGKKLEDEGFDVNFDFFLTESNIITTTLGWSIHKNAIKDELVHNVRNYKIKFKILTLLLLKLSQVIGKPVFNHYFIKEDIDLTKIKFHNYRVISGYFQEKNQIAYFSSGLYGLVQFLKTVRTKFQPKNEFENVIHFRGKDSNHINRNKELLKMRQEECKLWHIVTDDLNYAKKELSNKNIKVIGESAEVDFFQLAGASKNLICSNSTFSWWASHLVGGETTIHMPKELFKKSGYWNSNEIQII